LALVPFKNAEDIGDRFLELLADLGIDIEAVTHQLQIDGVAAFSKPFDALMKSIAQKREKLIDA